MINVNLRALTTTDIEKTLSWHNKKEISNLYSGHPFPVNLEFEKKWYENILTSNIPTTVFGIEHIETNELIGITILKNINLINRCSEFAIYIGNDSYLGKGLSTEATILTLKFGFHNLGLNRIYLKVLSKNSKALNLYKKIGFKHEGILKESVFKENEFIDEVIMAILKKEFDGKL